MKVAEETGQVFMVHQNRRWDEDFLTVKKIYNEKMTGEIFHIESRVHGANGIPGDWRHLKKNGGGMVLDWGVHLLDQLLFMIHSPVTSVYANLSYVLGDEVDDGFQTYLTFANGITALVEVEQRTLSRCRTILLDSFRRFALNFVQKSGFNGQF